MQEQDIFKTVAVYATPILLAIITFFLKALLSRFNDLEKEVNKVLIKHEGFEVKMLKLEQRIDEMAKQIDELQRQLWEFISRK